MEKEKESITLSFADFSLLQKQILQLKDANFKLKKETEEFRKVQTACEGEAPLEHLKRTRQKVGLLQLD